jgi:hypothetical protein
VHICSPPPSRRCALCGAASLLQYCTRCGMEISLPHACFPRPALHHCAGGRHLGGTCPVCRGALPIPTYCTRCGAALIDAHICIPPAALHSDPLTGFRPVLPPLPRPARHFCSGQMRICAVCRQPVFSSYCGMCGADLSNHVCKPKPAPHHCFRALNTERCSLCGTMIPFSYCAVCGAKLVDAHICSRKW